MRSTFLNQRLAILAAATILLLTAAQTIGVAGNPIPHGPPSSKIPRRDGTGNPDAATDLYGLGVRIGFYLQGFTQLLHVIPRRIDSGRGVKLACAGVALSILSSWAFFAREKLFSPCEAYLLTFILNSVSLPAGMTMGNPDAIVGEGFALFLSLATLIWTNVTTTWTYATLWRTLPVLDTKNMAYFFGAVSVTGWFRVLMLALSSISWVFQLPQIVLFFRIGRIALKCYLKGIGELPEEDRKKLEDSGRKFVTGLFTRAPEQRHVLRRHSEHDGLFLPFDKSGRKRRARILEVILPVSRLIALILAWAFCILFAEKTITLNGLSPATDLSAPAQLIPLVTGIIVAIDGVLFMCRPLGGKPAEQWKENRTKFDSMMNFTKEYFESLRSKVDDAHRIGLGEIMMRDNLSLEERTKKLLYNIESRAERFRRVLKEYQILDADRDEDSYGSGWQRRLERAFKKATWNEDRLKKDLDFLATNVEEFGEVSKMIVSIFDKRIREREEYERMRERDAQERIKEREEFEKYAQREELERFMEREELERMKQRDEQARCQAEIPLRSLSI